MFFVALLCFYFRTKALKVLHSWMFYLKKTHFVATSSKTCALTSRKTVYEPDISIPNLLQKTQFFWSHFSFSALGK